VGPHVVGPGSLALRVGAEEQLAERNHVTVPKGTKPLGLVPCSAMVEITATVDDL
jgi:hypothetical protein